MKQNNTKKDKIENDMEDVIKTSTNMRDYLLDEKVNFEDKRKQLKIFQTALDLNKNIVSSSIVKITLEKLK